MERAIHPLQRRVVCRRSSRGFVAEVRGGLPARSVMFHRIIRPVDTVADAMFHQPTDSIRRRYLNPAPATERHWRNMTYISERRTNAARTPRVGGLRHPMGRGPRHYGMTGSLS
jgi:hypothetical protein